MNIFNKILPKHKKINETSSFIPISISNDIKENINRIENDFGHSNELKVNYIKFGGNKNLICANIFIKGLVDKLSLNILSLELSKLKCEISNDIQDNIDILLSSISGLRDSKEGSDYESLYSELLAGNTIFLINGCNKYLAVMANNEEGRSIEEPTSQTIIRGPKEAFTEKIGNNILLIRKRIKNKALKVENISLGSITKTTIGIIYIDKIAKEEIIQEIRNRLSSIKIDGILDSGNVEELIKDDRYSIFPTFLNSEKPDSVVAALLEGKVAILVDGSPYVLTMPALMVEFFQTSEDYYHHFIPSSLLRIIRFIAFILTLLVPAMFVAITTFHQEMIPTALLINVAAQHEGVPFPTFHEALIMGLIFEILNEAGIRMPRAVGGAISIVGALVLGQAAVEAGLVSAAMVIVVSITAISSFAIPNYEMSNAIRLIRLALSILGGTLGLYGIFMGLIIMVLHLCKLKSITVPYLTPFAPGVKNDNRDTIFRFPLWEMEYRPAATNGTDKARVKEKNPVKSNQKGKPELK